MKTIQSKYLKNIVLVLLCIISIFELYSIYKISSSECNCTSSYLWMFCLSTIIIIPCHSVINMFSPSHIYLNSRYLNTQMTITLLIFDLLLLYLGYLELFEKCPQLKLCFIWINGIVNLILLIITIIFILFLYVYNFKKFTNLNIQNELQTNLT